MARNCQHVDCRDDATEEIELDLGDREGLETFHLCEDHRHMSPDGTPVDGYKPNDPEKFTAV